jgi:putative ABC transport system ATP-binding protein
MILLIHCRLFAACMATVLEGRGLWKIYQSGSNKIEALREISLTIEAGEMVAIMGPSGCGKTTLLNCLSGLDELTAGEVFVEGISLTASDDKHRTNVRGRNLGFIFQSFNLIPVLTAVENVEMPLLLQGIPAKEARQRSLDALDLVGLKNWSTHRPMELSGGQRQRVTIARAFVHKPAVILGDEPTGNLDSRTSKEVMDLLFELNAERGTTLLVVTHDSEIAARCSRILHMEDGLIVRDEKSEEE